MTAHDWEGGTRALGAFLNGNGLNWRTPHGEPVHDDSFLVLLNTHHEPLEFTLPARRFGARWALEIAHGAAGAGAGRALVDGPPGGLARGALAPRHAPRALTAPHGRPATSSSTTSCRGA